MQTSQFMMVRRARARRAATAWRLRRTPDAIGARVIGRCWMGRTRAAVPKYITAGRLARDDRLAAPRDLRLRGALAGRVRVRRDGVRRGGGRCGRAARRDRPRLRFWRRRQVVCGARRRDSALLRPGQGSAVLFGRVVPTAPLCAAWASSVHLSGLLFGRSVGRPAAFQRERAHLALSRRAAVPPPLSNERSATTANPRRQQSPRENRTAPRSASPPNQPDPISLFSAC